MIGCKYVVHPLWGGPGQTKVVRTHLRPLSTAVETALAPFITALYLPLCRNTFVAVIIEVIIEKSLFLLIQKR